MIEKLRQIPYFKGDGIWKALALNTIEASVELAHAYQFTDEGLAEAEASGVCVGSGQFVAGLATDIICGEKIATCYEAVEHALLRGDPKVVLNVDEPFYDVTDTLLGTQGLTAPSPDTRDGIVETVKCLFAFDEHSATQH